MVQQFNRLSSINNKNLFRVELGLVSLLELETQNLGTGDSGGLGQVGTGGTESVLISDVIDSDDLAVGGGVRVGSGHHGVAVILGAEILISGFLEKYVSVRNGVTEKKINRIKIFIDKKLKHILRI